MAKAEPKHETVLDVPARQSRLARVYAESLLVAAQKESAEAVVAVGDELADLVRSLSAHPEVAEYLLNPTHGKKAKLELLRSALANNASDLLRGLIGVLASNNRLDLIRGISRAYSGLLNERAGRVPVKVTVAVPLTNEQTAKLLASMKQVLRKEPVLEVRDDPDLLGGMIVQVGDSVIDTSVRSRLLSLRSLLLEKGASHGS